MEIKLLTVLGTLFLTVPIVLIVKTAISMIKDKRLN
jgi:hypothetical protein